MAKNRFAAEGTFNNKIIVLKIDIVHEIFQNRPISNRNTQPVRC